MTQCYKLIPENCFPTGAVMLLGRTNMFRFNNPAEAAKMKKELNNVSHLFKCHYSWLLCQFFKSTSRMTTCSLPKINLFQWVIVIVRIISRVRRKLNGENTENYFIFTLFIMVLCCERDYCM